MNNVELLSNALNYIENNISEKITAEDIAFACHCSKSYLQKIFKYVNGYSIKEYVIKRRITKAAKDLVCNPAESILDIAFKYCYNSPEAFTRAFEQVWRRKPSVFRKEARFTDLYPKLLLPIENGDDYMNERKHVDISELYDLFIERKECYFVCCDIKSLDPINEISRKAGDLAILEVLRRMEKVAGPDDIVFRIGGDEFTLLTNSRDITYASSIADKILIMNGQSVMYEDKEIPISVHTSVTRLVGSGIKYDELFICLHNTIKNCK